MRLPKRVTVYEVGPRDGFQNLPRFIPTHAKIAFINALAASGLPAVEATSFVSPKWVPQLNDASAVMRGIKRLEGVRYPVLVPNEIGLDHALAAGVEEIAVFTAASETFNRRNINATIDESIERFRPVIRRALEANLRVRGYVSVVFGCPYQGDVEVDAVLRVTERLFALGCAEVSLGDTIGVADPVQVLDTIGRLAAVVDLSKLALHVHDTYGRGLANIMAGLEAGITTFDSSAGGLGGCPYAPGASGNLATEDLLSLLDRLDITTGVDLVAVVEASAALSRALDLELPSRALAALWPRYRPALTAAC